MDKRCMYRMLASAFATAAAALPATALAQAGDWSVTGAGSGATPLNGPYDDEYGTGFTGAVGVYRSLTPELGIGLRVDGGALTSEDDVDGSLSDGTLGFGAVGPAVRYRPLQQLGIEGPNGNRGLYLEVAGGLGLLDDQLEPVVAPAAGYLFDFGGLGLGPTARYLQVLTGDDEAAGGEDVRIMTVGLELVFLDGDTRAEDAPQEYTPEPTRQPAASRQREQAQQEQAMREQAQQEQAQQEQAMREQAQQEQAQQEQARQEQAMREQARREQAQREQARREQRQLEQTQPREAQNEAMNPDQADRQGLQRDQVQPVAGMDDETDPSVGLDEQILFADGAVDLDAEGQRQLDRIAHMYRDQQASNPSARLRVSGHADQRGPASHNMEVSRQRAESVRDYLVSLGVPASQIEVRAYGEEQPASTNQDGPDQLQANRRVEIELVPADSNQGQ